MADQRISAPGAWGLGWLGGEALGGVALFITAVGALLWANSPWASAYTALWHLVVPLNAGSLSFSHDLHFWVNDGLMTIFFFAVGLEIRRELVSGALADPRRAALPAVAAVGGMLVPAGLYLAINAGSSGMRGWGVPMATDIAFAVGVLALLGRRVSPELRLQLLALAVIDDVGAILVIALFYSSGLSFGGLALFAASLAVIAGLRRFGVRGLWAYLVPAAMLWIGAYNAGIHPTLAGVIWGLTLPVAAPAMLDRWINTLHPWITWGVLPLFALANAGVVLGGISLSGDAGRVFWGVVAGLAVGKPLGVLGLSWAAARAGIVALPDGASWRAFSVVGAAASVGFTMALFVAQLAFPPGTLLETAKLAVLVGSTVGGVAAWGFGRLVLPLR